MPKVNPALDIHETYTRMHVSNPFINEGGSPVTVNPNLLQSPNTFTANWTLSGLTVTSTSKNSPEATTDATELNISSGRLGIYQTVNFSVVAGNFYTVSAWLRVSSGTGQVNIGLNGISSPLNDIGVDANLTDTWQKFTCTFQAAVNDSGFYCTPASTRWDGGTGSKPAITLEIWQAKLENGNQAT